LADAQGKALSALSRRAEETEARSHVRTIELEILQAGQQPPREGHEVSHTDLEKARKALAVAEAKAESEERLAQEAMKAAGLKMAQAETKATYAQRLANNDLTLEPVKITARLKRKSPEKSAAIAVGPSSAASPKPAIKKGATKTSKNPDGDASTFEVKEGARGSWIGSGCFGGPSSGFARGFQPRWRVGLPPSDCFQAGRRWHIH
jgi:hypothetical protein